MRSFCLNICSSYWTVAVLNTVAGVLSLCLLWSSNLPIIVAIAAIYALSAVSTIIQGYYSDNTIRQLRETDHEVRMHMDNRLRDLKNETDHITAVLAQKAQDIRMSIFQGQLQEARILTASAGYNTQMNIFNTLGDLQSVDEHVSGVYFGVSYNGTGNSVLHSILAHARTLPVGKT